MLVVHRAPFSALIGSIAALIWILNAYAALFPSQVCKRLRGVPAAAAECREIIANGRFPQNGLDLCLLTAEQGDAALANRCMRAIKDREISDDRRARCGSKSLIYGVVNCLED